jgi:hypothetical protein
MNMQKSMEMFAAASDLRVVRYAALNRSATSKVRMRSQQLQRELSHTSQKGAGKSARNREPQAAFLERLVLQFERRRCMHPVTGQASQQQRHHSSSAHEGNTLLANGSDAYARSATHSLFSEAEKIRFEHGARPLVRACDVPKRGEESGAIHRIHISECENWRGEGHYVCDQLLLLGQ